MGILTFRSILWVLKVKCKREVCMLDIDLDIFFPLTFSEGVGPFGRNIIFGYVPLLLPRLGIPFGRNIICGYVPLLLPRLGIPFHKHLS